MPWSIKYLNLILEYFYYRINIYIYLFIYIHIVFVYNGDLYKYY